MNAEIAILTQQVRKALDDIAPSVTDDFSSNLNEEISQALLYAAMSLSQTLPLSLLDVTVEKVATVDETSGHATTGYMVLPDEYMRLVSIRMASWKGDISELMERGSEAEKRQRSKWSQGTNSKPKAMLDGVLAEGKTKQVIRLWPCNDDTVTLSYIKRASISNDRLICALKPECEKNLVHLTCRIILEGKKEQSTAEAFANLTEL